MSGGGGGVDTHMADKKVAVGISVLALGLAVAGIMGQKAQTATLQYNIEASDKWAFYQAKNVRQTMVAALADQSEAMLAGVKDAEQRKQFDDKIKKWRATAQRYESEPGVDGKPGDGKKELQLQALEKEKLRDKYGKKHTRFELASGAFQIAIVLASAAVITSLTALLWISGGLGALGLVLLVSGLAG